MPRVCFRPRRGCDRAPLHLSLALVKLSLESTIIALQELSQGFATNEAAEAFGIELGKRWIDERR